MSRLTHDQINDHMAEDHTCQGCLLDMMDCKCMEHFDDGICLSDLDRDDPDFDMEPYDDNDMYPHDDDFIPFY